MKKSSVYLSDSEVARLTWLAEREGRSQSEVLRAAIRAYTPQAAPDGEFALFDSGESPGILWDELDERELLAGFGDEGATASDP
jgi:hypothetical protein